MGAPDRSARLTQSARSAQPPQRLIREVRDARSVQLFHDFTKRSLDGAPEPDWVEPRVVVSEEVARPGEIVPWNARKVGPFLIRESVPGELGHLADAICDGVNHELIVVPVRASADRVSHGLPSVVKHFRQYSDSQIAQMTTASLSMR